MNDTAIDYQQLLTETLQKQMVILGPAITLAKANHVEGLRVSDDGRITGIYGNPQQVSIKLLEQFRELSPLMVKKTMKPLLETIISSYPQAPTKAADAAPAQDSQTTPAVPDVQTPPANEHQESEVSIPQDDKQEEQNSSQAGGSGTPIENETRQGKQEVAEKKEA